jgi:hypothetical protein
MNMEPSLGGQLAGLNAGERLTWLNDRFFMS